MGIETRPGNQCERVIREVEASKASLFPTKDNFNVLNWNQTDAAANSANIDENYLVIGAHIDQAIQQKIVNNEYVDFAKLIPKGRLGKEEDHQLEIVSQGVAPHALFPSLIETTQSSVILQSENKPSGYSVTYIPEFTLREPLNLYSITILYTLPQLLHLGQCICLTSVTCAKPKEKMEFSA